MASIARETEGHGVSDRQVADNVLRSLTVYSEHGQDGGGVYADLEGMNPSGN